MPNIRENGVAIQWSMDVTECAHITEIKHPLDLTNNQDYKSQICRFLDCAEKCWNFNLATAICNASIDFRSINPVVGIIHDHDNDNANNDGNDNLLEGLGDRPTYTVNTTATLLSAISPAKQLVGMPRCATDYFSLAHMLKLGSYPHAPSSHHTFVAAETALHLNYCPNYSQIKIKAIAAKFKLPDLHVILSSYLAMCTPDHCHVSGPAGNLPFDTLEVWEKLWVQNQAYYVPHNILLAQTINASPSSVAWPCG